MLEPEAAVLALPHRTPARSEAAARDRRARSTGRMEDGDVIAYMECNFAFHFGLYRANGRPTLNRLIEALWLQFGPFMRVRLRPLRHRQPGRPAPGRARRHRGRGDAPALRSAIASDIADGMGLIGKSRLDEPVDR